VGELVARILRERIQREIAPCPVEVGPAHVDGARGSRAAMRRIRGEGSRVREQVEHAAVPRALAHHAPCGAVIEEQPGVEEVREVHLEAEPLLAHGANRHALAHALVLREPPLPLTALDPELVGAHAEPGPDLVEGRLVEALLLLGGVIARARVEPHHYLTLVPVDHEGELGDITLVDPEAGRVFTQRPLRQVPESLAEAVG